MHKLLRMQIPIRLRLTLWYLLLMGITFMVFGFFLFARFQRSLLNAIDTSLQIAVAQTLSSFDIQEELEENQQLAFEHIDEQMASMNFGMRLISVEGLVWDSYGVLPEFVGDSIDTGYSTQDISRGEYWRVLSQPISDATGTTIGWMQAAQSLETVTETLREFRVQLLWGIPLILLFAGFGGYFLANRALRPIEYITNTTQEITASDLSRRLDYQGPVDEIGKLARTFDQMLERLQEAFQRERRFTSDAAHELRTPLTVLKGQIEVTLARPRQRAEYEQKLQELGFQVDRLIRVSNALLFLSRSSQNQLSWEPVSVNLSELLDVIVEQIHPLAKEKGLAVRTDLPPELPVTGDTDHLSRLFLNLLDNAVKYTPEGGRITITAANDNTRIGVVIFNSGPGISPEHLPYLFDRFYRVQGDRSRETGGAGLGLAIAREIVRRHGGEIRSESEPGQGVTVTVSLPGLSG